MEPSVSNVAKAELRPVVWTTNDALMVLSLSGYGLAGPGGDASMRGQSVATLAAHDGGVLLQASQAALAGSPQSLEVHIAGVRHTVTLHPLHPLHPLHTQADTPSPVIGTVGVAIVSEQQRLQYETLVEASPYCIHSINQQRQFSSINRVGLHMLGETRREAVLGRSYASVVHPDDAAQIAKMLDRGFAGETVDFEFRDREGKTLRSSVIPIRDANGQVTSLLGFTEDLSPRLEVLTRLKQSEERHRILIEKAPYCIHEINNNGCLTSMNPAGLDMMGVEAESAIVGLRYLDIIVEAERPQIAELLNRALQGHVSMFEFEATNGQFFQSNFVPILGDDDKVVRMMGLTQNITEQKLAERALKASEQRLELALKGGDLGLWDLDLPTGVVIFNDRWASMLGLDPTQTPDRLDARMARIHPEDLEEVRARLDAHLRGQTPFFASEHRVRRSDGEWRWIQERGAVVQRDDAGAPLRLTGTSQDLSERRQAEAQQQQLEAQLLHSQKMESIGQLAGGVAHDFNNLLVAILGHAELAQLDHQAKLDVSSNLDAIHHAAERAAELTQRLLAFGHRQRMQRRNVDLNECIETLLKMLGRLLPESMHIELELGQALPKISADPAQLEQIIMNLCVNARDAMPGGGVLRVATSLRQATAPDRPDMVALTIEDEGEGMDAAVQARMFEPFFTTKSTGAGTGLGLSMVYGIVKQHEGTIHVDSSPGQGSTFVIELPAASGEEQPKPAAPPVATGGRGQTILVAEDEALVRTLVVSMLERNGYRVLVAHDGLQAIEVFGRHASEISLVLMDAVMPGLGGYRAREQILAVQPEVKFLMTSGYMNESGGAEAQDIPLLVKPYSMDMLLRMVGEALESPPL